MSLPSLLSPDRDSGYPLDLTNACSEQPGSFQAGRYQVSKMNRAEGGSTEQPVGMDVNPVACSIGIPLACRSVETVLMTDIQGHSVAGSAGENVSLLFNRFPLIKFGQEDLNDISTEVKALDVNFRPSPMGVAGRQKLASLLLKELNLKRMLGQASEQEVEETECRINELFNEIDPDLLQDPYYGLGRRQSANPLFLWPVTEQNCALLKKKSRCSESVLKEIFNISRGNLSLSYAGFDQIVLFLKDIFEVAEDLSEEKHDQVELNFNYEILPETYEKIAVEYEKLLKSIKDLGIILTYGVNQSEFGGVHLSEFERNLLACHQVYRQYKVKSGDVVVNSMYIDVLEIYKELMAFQLDLKTDRRLGIQCQHLAFVWADRVSEFFSIFSNDLGKLVQKNKGELLLGYQDISEMNLLSPERLGKTYLNKCFDLLKWAIDNGLHHLIDFKMLRNFTSDTVQYLVRNKIVNKYRKLLLQLADRQVHSAGNDNQKMMAYNEYIYICELLGDRQLFDEIWESALQYSVYPLFLRIIYDLGVVGSSENRKNNKTSIWIERAIYGLIEIRDKVKEFEHVIKRIEECLNVSDMGSVRIIKSEHKFAKKKSLSYQFVSRCAFYYFLAGGEKMAGQLLDRFGHGSGEKLFLYGLSLIAQMKYELAIMFMEKALKSDDLYGYIVKPILAILHCKIAKGFVDDQKKSTHHFKMAMNYLKQIVLVRKDFYKILADVQVCLAEYSAAIESLDHFCCYLDDYPLDSAERDQTPLIREQQEQLIELTREFAAKAEINSVAEASETKEASNKRNKDKGKGKSKMSSQSTGACQRQNLPVNREMNPEPEKILKPTDSPDTRALATTAPEMVKEQKTILAEDLPSGDVYGGNKELDIGRHLDSLSMEDAEYEPWQTVENRKKECSLIKSERLTEVYVEQLMRSTRGVRLALYNALTRDGRVDYKALLDKHNVLLRKHKHPVIQMLLIQNKVWTQRTYSFDLYALTQEAKRTGNSILELKMALRKSSMDILYAEIEKIVRLWGDCLPRIWKTEPAFIPDSQAFRQYQHQVAKRFSVQFGAQFSTLAYIKEDIYHDQPPGEKDWHKANDFYSKKPDEFHQLAKQYYQCRNRINPEHQSR
nr:hypothetical protein [Endozoicomonas sp.]